MKLVPGGREVVVVVERGEEEGVEGVEGVEGASAAPSSCGMEGARVSRTPTPWGRVVLSQS